jgi:hypothetical protein
LVKRISVEQAKPGQILAEEITRQDGVLLASRASEVTEGLIRLLGRMNIDTVAIEEDEQRTRGDIEAEHAAELARIGRVFRRAGDSPILAALMKTLVFLSEQERDKSLTFLEMAEGEGSAAGPEAPSPRADGAASETGSPSPAGAGSSPPAGAGPSPPAGARAGAGSGSPSAGQRPGGARPAAARKPGRGPAGGGES